jgi:tripartite-type tricarboxylate transporter receptor subunit TctC
MPSSRLLCACAAATFQLAQPALAEEVPDFKGRTVTLVASFEAGGPYDFYTRLIARYIGPHLPGGPNVIVQNMPGAGGLRGANFIFNVAPRDGTVMGDIDPVPGGEVLKTVESTFDIRPDVLEQARKLNPQQ